MNGMDWQKPLLHKARWRWWEFVLWAGAFALPLVTPSHSLMVNEIAIAGLCDDGERPLLIRHHL